MGLMPGEAVTLYPLWWGDDLVQMVGGGGNKNVQTIKLIKGF